MVIYTSKILNIFFSRSCADDKQNSIYYSLCEEYNDDDHICIIDVDNNYNNGVNDKLCEGILHEIKKCDLFICILTPTYNNNEKVKYINNNVIFELGYAYNSFYKENIFIFVEDDETIKRDFEILRPSMLSSIKYKTYTEYDDINDIIKQKYEHFKNCYNINYNGYILLDKNVVSLIKYKISQLLNNNNNIKKKLSKLEYYIENYKDDDIIEMVFLFIDEYINRKQLAYYALDWFFNFLSNNILDSYWYNWVFNKNNQIKILNLLKVIQYLLFEKFISFNKVKINTNRRNFAIVIFELLKTKQFTYKNELEILLKKSINNKLENYKIFFYKLKFLHNSKNQDEKNYYEDLITNSKNRYNKYII